MAIDWAKQHGWNPGLNDLDAFFQSDPNGFLIGWLGDQPISSISVVKYGDGFGFLGFYIVHPDYCGKGYGLQTWQAGMAYLQGRVVGLDGVTDQIGNYEKSGFVLAGRNVRFSGHARHHPVASPDIVDFNSNYFNALCKFDRQHFFTARPEFLQAWVNAGQQNRHKTKLAVQNGEICGYGTIRPCHTGHKIAPVFANTSDIAESLILALCNEAPIGAEISIDIPQENAAAIKFAEHLGLKAGFETARMYLGQAPDLPLGRIYGISSFELG